MPAGLLDAVVPITYSVHAEQMHLELRAYKDSPSPAVQARIMRGLTAVLWRFLDEHEICISEAAGADGLFDVVTPVPSKTTERDGQRNNLRSIVGYMCTHTADRYQRVLRPTDAPDSGHDYDPDRYACKTRLDGSTVLLIDDTWTRGGSVHAAANALRQAGAERVAAVVIGRHIHRNYEVRAGQTADDRLRELTRPFDWTTCAVH